MTARAKIHLVGGARPNFMKVAPIYHQLRDADWCETMLVHTGQHSDPDMSDVFFRDLQLPKPDFSLGISGGSHAEQLGHVAIAYEKLLLQSPADLVVVVGDVNGTAACTLAAKKLQIPVAHIEAGLRSRDRTMPEEINRLVTDAICDLHLTPSRDADDNLKAEGIPPSSIRFVGNVMIDSLVMMESRLRQRPNPFPALPAAGYAIATFHRPANVDHVESLKVIVDGLNRLSARIPVLFPLHPRTRKQLDASGLMSALAHNEAIVLTPPLGYADFIRCLLDAGMAVTDSGGLQEETTYLGIPCFTARDTTERPVTITHGTNRLISLRDIASLPVSTPGSARTPPPEYWDGHTAARIADVFRSFLASKAN